MNQYLAEWLAVKVSYIQVGAKCDHVIFASSDQRSLDPLGFSTRNVKTLSVRSRLAKIRFTFEVKAAGDLATMLDVRHAEELVYCGWSKFDWCI